MDPIEQAKQLMMKTYTHPLPLEELCEEIGMSYHILKRRFRKAEGMTMSQFYQELRLHAAERLLRDTDKLIFEITYELGFSDESNFSNWFYKRKRMWPTCYRRQYEKNVGGVENRLPKNAQFEQPS